MFMEENFFALQRFATINKSTENTLINGTNSDDTITLNTGAGNDLIQGFNVEFTMQIYSSQVSGSYCPS